MAGVTYRGMDPRTSLVRFGLPTIAVLPSASLVTVSRYWAKPSANQRGWRP